MVNKRRKGYRAESLVRRLLEENGWFVWRPTQGKWGNKDIFGLFDLIAIKHSFILLIQVKTNQSDVSVAKKEIQRFVLTYGKPEGVEYWLVLWGRKRRYFKIDKYGNVNEYLEHQLVHR